MSLNEAQANYNVTQAELAEKIEPVTTAMKQGLTDLMVAAMQLFANVDFAAWAAKIEGGFNWIINTGIPFLTQNLPTIGFAIAGIGAAFLAFNFAGIIAGITTGVTALWAVLAANPVGLVILGLTLIITAFKLLWDNCEGFRNFWIGLWEGIKGAVKTGVNGIISMLNWFIGKINTISIGPLPKWDILGEYAGAEVGFSIPKIPMLAKGGIATGPTLAMVGEGKEDEAIMPLSKLGSLMGGMESASIVYSPNITVMPGANGADVKEALSEGFEQFKTYMDRYLREKKRHQSS